MGPRLLPGKAKPLDGDGHGPRVIFNLPPALGNLDEVVERVGRNAVLIGIGALDQKLAQLLLLRRIELARAAWLRPVEQCPSAL